MDNWKTDRRVQLAIGLAVVFVAAKWLFTGSLFYAAVDMTAAPSEGQTKSGIAFSALIPVVFDLAIGAFIGIGAYVINLAELLVGRVRSLVGQPEPITHAATTVSAAAVESVSLDSPGSMRSAVMALGDAAASNDLDQLEKLRKQIRKPYALAELNDAYSKGDTAAAADLVDELNRMIESAPTSAKKKGGSSNA